MDNPVADFLPLAQQVAVEAGRLQTCEFHPDEVFQGDPSLEDEAYRFGRALFNKGDIGGNWTAFQRAVEVALEQAPSKCARCEQEFHRDGVR